MSGGAPTGGRSPRERLGHPDLVPLVDELARRFSSGHRPARITLPALGDGGRSRLADLLGLDRYPLDGGRIGIDRLATAVGAGDVDGLRAIVAELTGPLEDRRAARAAAEADRVALWDHAEEAAGELRIFAGPHGRAAWIRRLTTAGVPDGDVDRHRRRVDAAIACLGRLPAGSAVTLAGLAAEETGSAHGLDPGRRLTRMVLDGLAIAFEVAPPADAESARALWERAGVMPDPLSSAVLAIGFQPPGTHWLAGYLRAAAAHAEPVVLTLRQVQGHRLGHRPPGGMAYVVENPSLIADVAGNWNGPPLICSSGRPTMAVVELVRQLVAGGTVVRQHADFDGPGIDITRWLSERAGTVPWRMDADDYSRAAACRPTIDLSGPIGPTPWSPELGPTMDAIGRAVHEEAIRTELLEEIGRPDDRS